VADLGDLLALGPDLETIRRAQRRRVRCRNPRCRRWVYVDRAVFGYGEDCAEELGLVVHRWKLTDHGQAGPTLLDTLEAPMSLPRRFLLRAAGATVAEGVIFTDGAAVVYRHPATGEHSSNRHFDRYPVGTVVAGRLAAGEIPRAIVPLAGNAGDELALEWVDLDGADPEAAIEAVIAAVHAGAVPAETVLRRLSEAAGVRDTAAPPARRAELAEPDLTAGAYE
jgi:hypothetical protein